MPAPLVHPGERAHRRSPFARAVLVLAGAVALLAATTTAAQAKRTYVSTVTARQSATVRATGTATVSVTASASAGQPAIVKRVTVRLSARASSSAKVTASARVRVHAASRAAAHRKALARARKTAKARATARARALARSRAAASARNTAHARAAASAAARALAAARTAVTQRAAATPPVKTTPPPVKTTPPPVTTPPVTTPPTPAPCGGTTPPGASGSGWRCTFDDEFDGTTLNPKNWSPMTTTQYGFRNEPGCYVDSPSAIAVSGGTLKLTTRPAATPFTCADPLHGNYTATYTSGSVTSSGKFAQRYGSFSVRAKFSAATVAGLQSSLWMWPSNADKYGPWPLSGELDIAEEYSVNADRAIPYLHYGYAPSSTVGTLLSNLGLTGTNIPTNDYCMITDVNAFHTYTMTWAPGTITIQFDGNTCLVDRYVASGLPTPAPFDQPFFVNLTQGFGVGANAPTAKTPLPATTEIDYVRAWEQS
jgi:beta-glucanase (GH16 family)